MECGGLKLVSPEPWSSTLEDVGGDCVTAGAPKALKVCCPPTFSITIQPQDEPLRLPGQLLQLDLHVFLVLHPLRETLHRCTHQRCAAALFVLTLLV